jgi:hypothetical protein
MQRSLMVKFSMIAMVVISLTITLGACSTPSATTTPTGMPQYRPIEVVAVVGPVPPHNPGGTVVEITLKNNGTEPVVQLKTVLQLEKNYDFDFPVTTSAPLNAGQSISRKLTLLGPGSTVDSEASYLLKITATLQSGSVISYSVQVKIGPPSSN